MSPRHRAMLLPNNVTCIDQYTAVFVKVASYGVGMCHSHRKTMNAVAAVHNGQAVLDGLERASPSARSGAAASSRIMCWVMRALNRATDKAHSGETSATAVTNQPQAA